MARRLLVVGGDLMAQSRIEDAARRAGFELAQTPPGSLEAALSSDPSALVIVDLDSGGREVLAALAAARESANQPVRVIGYYSHVDAELGEAARGAGVEAYPRGRFWRTLPEILGAPE